jgi:hypothetical protein
MEDEPKYGTVKKAKKIRWANPQVREFAELHNQQFRELSEILPRGTGVKVIVLAAAKAAMTAMAITKGA